MFTKDIYDNCLLEKSVHLLQAGMCACCYYLPQIWMTGEIWPMGMMEATKQLFKSKDQLEFFGKL